MGFRGLGFRGLGFGVHAQGGPLMLVQTYELLSIFGFFMSLNSGHSCPSYSLYSL